jgi:hypothetical protein
MKEEKEKYYTCDLNPDMNKDDVNAVYTANRTNYYNQIIVNEFITMLYGMDGDEPLISTSSISTKAFRKEY